MKYFLLPPYLGTSWGQGYFDYGWLPLTIKITLKHLLHNGLSKL